MADRPILFSAPMVRAILAGRKTQTRRYLTVARLAGVNVGATNLSCDELADRCRCPYGVPGDRLWVRETWAVSKTWDRSRPAEMPLADSDRIPTWWRADGASEESWANRGRWRSSLHMPRWASRITLAVTAVRREPLQDISEMDARAEGVTECGEPGHDDCFYGTFAHRCAFERLWDAINGKRPGRSWADNPWVWVITFRRIHTDG